MLEIVLRVTCANRARDTAEGRQRTRRVSKIHGGFRCADDGRWLLADWSYSGVTIDGWRLPTGRWCVLPEGNFQLDIACGALRLEAQAMRGQALVLKRPAEESCWYVLLRHRVELGLSRRGLAVYSALRGSQLGFGLLYSHRGVSLVPGVAGGIECGGRSLGTHLALEDNLRFTFGGYQASWQQLMATDPAT